MVAHQTTAMVSYASGLGVYTVFMLLDPLCFQFSEFLLARFLMSVNFK